MTEDWAADVRKYVPNADEKAIAGIVRYCGIALQKRDSSLVGKRPTNPALAVHCRAWEVCSVIGKLVSTHDDGYGFGWPGAPAAMDEL